MGVVTATPQLLQVKCNIRMGILVLWRILEVEPSMSPCDERKLKEAEVPL